MLQPYQRELLERIGIDVSNGDDQTIVAAQSLYGIRVRVVDGPPGTLYLVNEGTVRKLWAEMAERIRTAPIWPGLTPVEVVEPEQPELDVPCVDCGSDTQSKRSPRCPDCRTENRRKANLARVRRYQSSAHGRSVLARYDRREKDRRYNMSEKGRARNARYEAEHPVVRPEPVPMPYVGDPVFEQARQAARVRSDYASDWGQNDMLGEAVLAILEGRDPDEAVKSYRRQEATHRALRANVPDMTAFGYDGHGRLLLGRYDDEAA